MIAWAGCAFQPIGRNIPQGYTFVNLYSPDHMLHNEVCQCLQVYGIPQARVLDIHFPTKGIVGLLIHCSFALELTDSLKKGGITPVTFNPLAASVIKVPKYASITITEKESMAKDIHQHRILCTGLHIPKAYLGFAIMQFFSDNNNKGYHKLPANLLEDRS